MGVCMCACVYVCAMCVCACVHVCLFVFSMPATDTLICQNLALGLGAIIVIERQTQDFALLDVSHVAHYGKLDHEF